MNPDVQTRRLPRRARAGLVALLALFLLAGPVAAEPRPVGAGQDYAPARVPVGVPDARDPARSGGVPVDAYGRTIIITQGPVILLAPRGAGPSPVVLVDLPLACLKLVAVQGGEVRLMEARCLAEAGIEARDLPGPCAVAYRARHGLIHGFDPACLGDAGYRLAGR